MHSRIHILISALPTLPLVSSDRLLKYHAIPRDQETERTLFGARSVFVVCSKEELCVDWIYEYVAGTVCAMPCHARETISSYHVHTHATVIQPTVCVVRMMIIPNGGRSAHGGARAIVDSIAYFSQPVCHIKLSIAWATWKNGISHRVSSSMGRWWCA